jgi:hypothetical protein
MFFFQIVAYVFSYPLIQLVSLNNFLYFQMSQSESDSSSDDGDQFFDIITKGAKLAEIYCDLYLHKAPPRVSIQTGIGWLQETMNTPGECHKMLRMNKEIFIDLHDVLVERYGLQPSKHMNTYEMLAIFLFICSGYKSNRRGQNRFKHSGETISRKFHEVLDCVMAMAEHYLRPTSPNFPTVHKRIRNDKEHIHTSRIALVHLMALIFVSLFHLMNKSGTLERRAFLLKMCLLFVILICVSPMWLLVNRGLTMTQVYCTMHLRQMKITFTSSRREVLCCRCRLS